MNDLSTKYGLLKGISTVEFYDDGSIMECKLDTYNEIETSYGKLIPQYEDDGLRRKYIKSLSFYKNGKLKSISLQSQTHINTSIGILPAELITFYESGSIKCIFPLNGKITAYWTERNEYNLAEEVNFYFDFAEFSKKIIGVKFYESGAVKSLTFWTGDTVTINTSAGDLQCRIGMSMYENGRLKSVEPLKPTIVQTPIGRIIAFDINAIGINGDINSLCFYEHGSLNTIYTSTDKIEAKEKNGIVTVFEPRLKRSILNENAMDVISLKIEFNDRKVRFNGDVKNEFNIDECDFSIINNSTNVNSHTNSCAGCGEE